MHLSARILRRLSRKTYIGRYCLPVSLQSHEKCGPSLRADCSIALRERLSDANVRMLTSKLASSLFIMSHANHDEARGITQAVDVVCKGNEYPVH